MPAVTNVLLNLSLLPTRCGITELSLEEVMADHGTKFGIDLTHFIELHSKSAAQQPEQVSVLHGSVLGANKQYGPI